MGPSRAAEEYTVEDYSIKLLNLVSLCTNTLEHALSPVWYIVALEEEECGIVSEVLLIR